MTLRRRERMLKGHEGATDGRMRAEHMLLYLLGHPSLSMLLGIGIGCSYAFFALIASRYYPSVYSPLNNNTLSQLGNHYLNPDGAIYYRIGCAVSGTLAMAFFASLTHWRQTGTEAQNRFLLSAQVLGVAGGFGLVMNAVYPEDQLAVHHIWAGVVFNCLGLSLLLSPFALWRRGHQNLTTSGVALIGSAAVVVMFVFARDHWVEWLPVTVFLIAPGVLGFRTRVVALSRHRH